MDCLKLLLLTLLLLLPASRVRADEDYERYSAEVCNEGQITVDVATAYRDSGIFNEYWVIERWKHVLPGACETVFEHLYPTQMLIQGMFGLTKHPLHLAFAFTDSTGVWGAARVAPPEDIAASHLQLCVNKDDNEYRADARDPATGCGKDGFLIPASIDYEPDHGDPCMPQYLGSGIMNCTSTKFTVTLGPNDRAIPLGSQTSASAAAPTGAIPKQTEPNVWDTLAALAKAYNASGAAAQAARQRERAAAEAQHSEVDKTPKPFDAGTLNAELLGKGIVRRSSGNGDWYYEDGSRVNPVYQIDGETKSYLLDAPAQRATTDREVIAAQQALQRALESWSWNRRTEILPRGRLFYSYADQGEVLHEFLVNIETLDLARAGRYIPVNGRSGFKIPCKEDRACVIGLDKDRAGGLSNNHIQANFYVYFMGDDSSQAAWTALLKLREFYPAEPAVVAR